MHVNRFLRAQGLIFIFGNFRQTSKSRKKQDRKRGRKGTIHEEEYILTSITKLVTQLAHFQGKTSIKFTGVIAQIQSLE